MSSIGIGTTSMAPHDESQYGEDMLPWAVEDNFDAFVQYLREND